MFLVMLMVNFLDAWLPETGRQPAPDYDRKNERWLIRAPRDAPTGLARATLHLGLVDK
jgi:hypothetical protein